MNENELEESMISMLDEDGNVNDFVVIDEQQYNGYSYLLVVEAEEADEDGMTAIVMKQVEDDGEELTYELVEDDDEFEAVCKLFQDNDDDEF